jgi:hypothetical protein
VWKCKESIRYGIGVTWRGGERGKGDIPIFFPPKNSFCFWATDFKRANNIIGVRVGERGVLY